jgi:hypothetical protein
MNLWWHWQNLKNDRSRAWFQGRAWVHHRPRGQIAVEWCIPSRSCHLYLVIGGCENQVCLGVALYLFALYLSVDGWNLLNRWQPAHSYQGRTLRIAIHDWALWWNFWTDEHEWSSKTPKWRDGSFQVLDVLLGKMHHKRFKGEPVPITLTFPEGSYPARITFIEHSWWRERLPWWVRHRREAEIDAGPSGVPIPGKGENSWDLEDGSLMIAGSDAPTIGGAIADFVKIVLERRERYGGSYDWQPEKKERRMS